MRCVPLTFIIVLLACGKSSERPAAESGPAPASLAVDEARVTFETLCSTCHGASGKGDGIAAANLDPKPRNYTDKAWQASVTDDQIRQIILAGGAAVGKSQMMPASPQFKDKPQVVDELVKIVRSFGK
jgi:cytochrome c553